MGCESRSKLGASAAPAPTSFQTTSTAARSATSASTPAGATIEPPSQRSSASRRPGRKRSSVCCWLRLPLRQLATQTSRLSPGASRCTRVRAASPSKAHTTLSRDEKGLLSSTTTAAANSRSSEASTAVIPPGRSAQHASTTTCPTPTRSSVESRSEQHGSEETIRSPAIPDALHAPFTSSRGLWRNVVVYSPMNVTTAFPCLHTKRRPRGFLHCHPGAGCRSATARASQQLVSRAVISEGPGWKPSVPYSNEPQ